MNLTSAIAAALIDALCGGTEENFARLSAFCSEDLAFGSSITAPTTGVEEVLGLLHSFQAAGRFARATDWQFLTVAEGLKVTAQMPLASFYERYEWEVTLDPSGKILTIVQKGVAQTAALPASPLHLTDEIAAALATARETRNPVILAYIDQTGRPSQSPRGTTQVLTERQLAFWNHNPEGSFIKALGTNPSVSIHYWGGIGNTFGGAMSFTGTAWISGDGAIRDKVYYDSPESEQRSDPYRTGCAVVVDLDRVSGFLAGTRYNMDAQMSESNE